VDEGHTAVGGRVLRIARVTVTEGAYQRDYGLGEIDTTHLFLKVLEERDNGQRIVFSDYSEESIKQGMVLHVGQLAGNLRPLYKSVCDWLIHKNEIHRTRIIT
jgi:hypothetical protein